jgi:hypothetical protein
VLARLNNEVLARGPEALLPQNLSPEWLQRLQKLGETFLDANYDATECREPKVAPDPVLSTCIVELSRASGAPDGELSESTLMERAAMYALWLMVENARRQHHLNIAPPGRDAIFSWQRFGELKQTVPDFVDALQDACVLKASKKGLLRIIKDKLSGI